MLYRIRCFSDCKKNHQSLPCARGGGKIKDFDGGVVEKGYQFA